MSELLKTKCCKGGTSTVLKLWAGSLITVTKFINKKKTEKRIRKLLSKTCQKNEKHRCFVFLYFVPWTINNRRF